MDVLAKAPRGSVIGRYVLQDEIAAGAMANVCLARVRGEPASAGVIAVKRLHRELLRDLDFVATAVKEARMAARVVHPNVLAPTDVVLVEGRELLFVMPYVPGETLAILFGACFRSGTRMPLAVTAGVMMGVLEGLHAAHEARDPEGAPMGIVHRGVSPQNVLVGLDGAARLIDFGLAAARARAQAVPEIFAKGKSCYMSPEQIRQEPTDRRTDIFAAGAVLWELLTGERLFRGAGPAELIRPITAHRIPPPSTVQPGVPEAIDAVVGRALQRPAAERFATAAEFALALSAALPPASRAEIGSWVAEVVSDRLRARAELVTLVENAPIEPMSAPGTEEMPWSAFERPSGSASAPAAEAPPPWARTPVILRARGGGKRTRARRRLVVGAGLLSAAGLAAWLLGRGAPARTPATASAPAGPPMAVTAVAGAPTTRSAKPPKPRSTPPPPSSSSPAPPSSSSPAPPSSSAPVAAARKREREPRHEIVRPVKKLAAAVPPRRAPPPARKAPATSAARTSSARAARPAADCDPPFTVDAQGIRRIKRECLR